MEKQANESSRQSTNYGDISMKKINSMCFIAIWLSFVSTSVFATGPYTSKIKTLQATSIGHPYNSVHLELDVNNSPCSGTNSYNRFTITSNAQYSTILAALMAGKDITIYGTGACNTVNIETVGDVRISP